MARFCGDCTHCGSDPYDGNPVKRECAAWEERRDSHIESRGKTPDAYFTAPDRFVYSNSAMAARCNWFATPNAELKGSR